MSEYIFEVEHLKKYFGPVKAVDDVSFKVRRGETLGLVGESGCGKTTIGRTVLRLMEPTAGSIHITTSLSEGEPPRAYDITAGERLRELRRKMQIVYQDPASSIDPRMIIRDVVAEPLWVHRVLKGAELEERVIDILRRVGLQEEHLWRFPYELSGGQRQRVAIARAIALNPEFLVLDEPTSALDVSVQAKILKLLKELQRELNMTYLFITHDMSVIDYMCNRVAVMYVGKIVELAEKEQLFEKPLHPYSMALLSAVPSKDPTTRKLSRAEILPGEVASPANPPPGCRFHPRCRFATPICGFGSVDLINFLKTWEKGVAVDAVARGNFHLEVRPRAGEDVGKVGALLSDLRESGVKSKTPLFEAIRGIENSDNKVDVYFNEEKEPDLRDVGNNRHVACVLYF